MVDILITQGQILHDILLQQITKNYTRLSSLKSTTTQLTDIFTRFINDLTKQTKIITKRIKLDENQDSNITFLNKLIIDMLIEIAKKFNILTKKINTDITEQFELFIEEQNNLYNSLKNKSGELFTDINTNISNIRQCNNYSQIHNNTTLKNHQKQQIQQIYSQQMNKCNENWSSIKNRYKNLMNQADYANSARCSFAIKAQIKLCELLDKIVNSANMTTLVNQYEGNTQFNENLSFCIKQRVRHAMGQSILLEQRGMQYFNKSTQLDHQDKTTINTFISMFTTYPNFLQDQAKQQKARTLIFSNTQWTKYFLNKFRMNLHTEIKLQPIKYFQMTTIIKCLFASCAQDQKNQQILYNILYISYRITCNGNYIIKQLGKHEYYWENSERWYKLISFIDKKRQQWLHSKKSSTNQFFKKVVIGGLNWIFQQPTKPNQKKTQKQLTDNKLYDILCQISYFMSRLELNEKFMFNFIVEAANHFGFCLENTKKLMKFDYINNQNSNNKMMVGYWIRKKRIQEKYKNISYEDKLSVCIGKCLHFLQIDSNLFSLRLINRSCSKQLRKKLAERCLISSQNAKLSLSRLKFYKYFCSSMLTKQTYHLMIAQLPKQTQNSEIILLDVNRSLQWDENLRNSLFQVLKCYQFHHKKIGYLQGMNYLCQHIFKITNSTYDVYYIFSYLMNHHFEGMFCSSFNGLKSKIYLLMKLLQRNKPKLYHHFQTQKLQGDHFLMPWAITLWGEMVGELCWVLWDGFICKGWKWWFKTIIWLLTILQPQLLNMNFQQMMKCFSDVNSGFLNMNSIQLKQYGIDITTAKAEIDKIEIQAELIKDIEKQYKIKVQMVNQYLEKFATRKKKINEIK